jgi:hypothetical protein
MKMRRTDTKKNGDQDVLNRPVLKFQVEFLASRKEDIENLMRITGSRTKRELFEHALTVFETLVKQAQKGKEVGWRDRNEDNEGDEQSKDFTTFVYPALENVKSYVRQTQSPESPADKRPKPA